MPADEDEDEDEAAPPPRRRLVRQRAVEDDFDLELPKAPEAPEEPEEPGDPEVGDTESGDEPGDESDDDETDSESDDDETDSESDDDGGPGRPRSDCGLHGCIRTGPRGEAPPPRQLVVLGENGELATVVCGAAIGPQTVAQSRQCIFCR